MIIKIIEKQIKIIYNKIYLIAKDWGAVNLYELIDFMI